MIERETLMVARTKDFDIVLVSLVSYSICNYLNSILLKHSIYLYGVISACIVDSVWELIIVLFSYQTKSVVSVILLYRINNLLDSQKVTDF